MYDMMAGGGGGGGSGGAGGGLERERWRNLLDSYSDRVG